MRSDLARYSGLLDLLAEEIAREIQIENAEEMISSNGNAPGAGQPAGRENNIDKNERHESTPRAVARHPPQT